VTLPIVRPHHPRLGLLSKDFSDALDTGIVTNGGRHVQAFEEALTRILGVPTLVFSSGMAAMIAMLRACDVQGMEVVCPSFTFAATPHAIVLAGAKPVFADIDENTLGLDQSDVERRITPRTTAILGVDPYGIMWEPPAGWKAGDVDILIDAAPSFGSELHGKNGVTRGRAQIYSFHATKPFSTMEGGALCSEDAGLIARAMQMRNFGQDSTGDCKEVGFNGKMAEVNALIGLRNLETWQYRATARVESGIRLRRALDSVLGVKTIIPPLGQSPIWTYQPIRVLPNFGKSRDQVAASLVEKGIGVRKYYTPCHMLSVYRKDHTRNLRVTEMIASQVIALPVYDEMMDTEIEQIVDALRAR
jgi:dTDP-4-amino-4,6-dideoxyglucose